jgi:hypothetical protein
MASPGADPDRCSAIRVWWTSGWWAVRPPGKLWPRPPDVAPGNARGTIPWSFTLCETNGRAPSPVLLGRASEREALDRRLENVRGGQSTVLVVRGEAGVALLRDCVVQAVCRARAGDAAARTDDAVSSVTKAGGAGLPQPHLPQRSRRRQPLRRLAGAGAFHDRDASGIQVAALIGLRRHRERSAHV